MYQVGELGDCFLLQFSEGVDKSNVLVDCGSFRNKQTSIARLKEVVANIFTQTGNKPLDVVIGTHQHNDHLSGYVHCESLFKGKIDQTWLSWLDDPNDNDAKSVAKDHKSLLDGVTEIHKRITEAKLGVDGSVQTLKDMLGFYGIENAGDPVIPAKGVEILKKIGKKKVQFLSPGQVLDLPGMTANKIKVYVLGPPRDQELLFDKDPKTGQSYDKNLTFAMTNTKKLLAALDNRTATIDDCEDGQFPFSESYKKTAATVDPATLNLYNKVGEDYRKIDNDWLDQANRLALYLNSYTNNSSLVLAFELVKSKKVLLFAADAQTGNWLSWNKIKWKGLPDGFTTYDLLKRTVLYKVGHHASHNATLVEAFEIMGSEELVAMIPVDKTDPNITKPNGWKMPATNLFKRLKEKTQNRVLRMDEGFAAGCDPVKNKTTSKWDSLPFKASQDSKNHMIEYTVQG
jgi:hypothetical protein